MSRIGGVKSGVRTITQSKVGSGPKENKSKQQQSKNHTKTQKTKTSQNKTGKKSSSHVDLLDELAVSIYQYFEIFTWDGSSASVRAVFCLFSVGFSMPLREYLVPRPQVAGAHFSHRRRLHAVSLCPGHLGFAAHWLE